MFFDEANKNSDPSEQKIELSEENANEKIKKIYRNEYTKKLLQICNSLIVVKGLFI